jgi:preprotein translocase subunit SecY
MVNVKPLLYVLYVTVYSMLNSFIWQQMSGMSEERAATFLPFGLSSPACRSFSMSATIDEVLCKFYIVFT